MQQDYPRITQKGNEPHLIDIRYLWGVLLDSRSLIIVITFLSCFLATAYSFLSTPVYQVESLLQLENGNNGNLFNEINNFLPGGISSADTELALIKSRSLLDKTVADLALTTEVNQKHFPIFGKPIARLSGQLKYKVDIEKFELPDELIGTEFTLERIDDGNYVVEGHDQRIPGKMGVPLELLGVMLLVNSIDAPNGTQFTLQKTSKFNAVDKLNKSFTVREISKDSGLLRITLKGEDPQAIRTILHTLSENYIEKNIAKKSASASNSLTFLQQQIPLVKAQLEKAENSLSEFRRIHNSVDLTLEARSILESATAVSSQLSTLDFEEADLSQLYTKSHPMYQAFIAKKQDLLNTQATLNKRINAMPVTQQDVLRLTRDVESTLAIYLQLLNKQQELSINKASTVGNVQVIDPAEVYPEPVYPRLPLFVLLGTLGGFLFSIIVVLVRNFFKCMIVNSNQIQALGLKVYSSVPLAMEAKRRSKIWRRSKRPEDSGLLALTAPDSLAIESLRSLRASLYFQLKAVNKKILMVVGPATNVGKSFVSSNLGVVFAQSGMKVLLVDADMRRGYLHETFGLKINQGLSAVLSGQDTVGNCIQSTQFPGLDILSRGSITNNPSELLLNKKLDETMNWAASHYDLVIVDTPPILAVADATIIANHSGINVMVARFEATTPDELAFAIKRFTQEGHCINGVVLNATCRRNSQYFQQGYYESYQYERKEHD
ncbi:polysaccharide biosynthesis tyrosine autokinase [Enterobacteriaceae bacterium RIT697]|nr:polysaccharide biosynthesis tyrosine autokinase [Enterobacteriaceae bacterium RIT697]